MKPAPRHPHSTMSDPESTNTKVDASFSSQPDGHSAVALYWIPLGAGHGVGARIVRLSGWIFEGLAAVAHHRPRVRLYHSALQLQFPEETVIVEQTPVP